MKEDKEKARVIRTAELDPNFRAEVMKHKDAQGLNACFACGTCTAGCPVHEIFTEYNPRKLAKMVKLGIRKEVLSSPYIWYCVTCHNCEQHCPQNVKFFNVLNVLKNMAAEAGYAPAPWVEQTQQIKKTGLVFPLDEVLAEKRQSLSLPVLKSEGVRTKRLLECVGLDKIKALKQS
jgi:heterodisulfide reductase subunit C